MTPGTRRVFAAVGVGSLRALRWSDVPDSPLVEDWLDAGLVRLTDLDGLPAPEVLPSPCCGR